MFYRYSEDEVRYWITYGRQNTPMPANGLEGGGALRALFLRPREGFFSLDFLEPEVGVLGEGS